MRELSCDRSRVEKSCFVICLWRLIWSVIGPASSSFYLLIKVSRRISLSRTGSYLKGILFPFCVSLQRQHLSCFLAYRVLLLRLHYWPLRWLSDVDCPDLQWILFDCSIGHWSTMPSSVADPWHFGVDPDPDPRIHASDYWIRIRIVDPDPSIFVIDLQDVSNKQIF